MDNNTSQKKDFINQKYPTSDHEQYTTIQKKQDQLSKLSQNKSQIQLEQYNLYNDFMTIGQRIGIRIICRIAPAKQIKIGLSANKNIIGFSNQINLNKYNRPQTSQHQKSLSAIINKRRSSRKVLNDLNNEAPQTFRDHKSSEKFTQSNSSSKQKNREFSSDSQKYNDQKMILTNSTNKHENKYENKKLSIDGQYSVFTTQKASRYVFTTDIPVQGKILNEVFQDPKDINRLKNINPMIFKFDGVYNEYYGSQELIYEQNIKDLIDKFVKGQNGCILLFGPSSSGKTYTLKGGQGIEKGIVPRAIQYILSSISNQESQLDKTPNFMRNQYGQIYSEPSEKSTQNNYILKLQIFMITESKIVDLLEKQKQTNSSQSIQQSDLSFQANSQSNNEEIIELNEKILKQIEDYQVCISDAFRTRKEISLNDFKDKDLRKKSHFVISLSIQKLLSDMQYQEISKFNFVELSGSEQAVACQNKQIKQQLKTQEFVSKSFNTLSYHLMKIVQQKKYQQRQNGTGQYFDTIGNSSKNNDELMFLNSLKQTLTHDSNILIISCVDPSPNVFEHSLPSLKFCSSLREHIKKRIKKALKNQKQSNFKCKTDQEFENIKQYLNDIKIDIIDSELFNKKQNVQQQIHKDQIEHLRLQSQNIQKIIKKLELLKGEYGEQNINKLIEESEILNSKIKQTIASKDKPLIIQLDEDADSQAYQNQQYLQLNDYPCQIKKYKNQATLQTSEVTSSQNEDKRSEGYGKLNNQQPQVFLVENLETFSDLLCSQNNPQNEQMKSNQVFSSSNQKLSGSIYSNPASVYDSFHFKNGNYKVALSQNQQFNTVDNRQMTNFDEFNNPQMLIRNDNSIQSKKFYFDQALQITKINQEEMRFQNQEYQNNQNINQYNEDSQTKGFQTIGESNSAFTQYHSDEQFHKNIDCHPTSMFPPLQSPSYFHDYQQPNNQKEGIDLIQNFKSKFNKVQRETPKPTFIKANDIPSKKQIIDEFERSNYQNDLKCNQINDYFENLKIKQLIYKDETELSSDVARLLLLQDNEGLKLRFYQLYKERDQVISYAQSQLNKFEPLEKQNQAFSNFIDQLVNTLQQNNDQFNQYLTIIEQAYKSIENDLLQELQSKENIQQQLQQHIIQQEDQMKSHLAMKESAEKERQNEYISNLEAQAKLKEIEQENAKLKFNYEILKEHEMSIIRDCDAKRKNDIQERDNIIQQKQEQFLQNQKVIDQLNQEIQNLNMNIKNIQNDLQIQINESHSYKAKIENKNQEMVLLKEESSKLKQKAFEDVELIKIMRQEHELMKNEIKRLEQEHVSQINNFKNSERSADTQHKMYLSAKEENKALQSQLQQSNMDKIQLQEDLSQKLIQLSKVQEKIEQMNQEFKVQANQLQNMIQSKESELLNVKAKSFDQMDFIKQIQMAELNYKNLQSQYELSKKDNDILKSQNDELTIQNQNMIQENERIEQELFVIKQSLEQNLDQFDNKFDDLNEQLQQFKQQNQELKIYVHQLQLDIREQEKQKAFWREKCKMAEQKGDQINQKILDLENELRIIIFEKNQYNTMAATQQNSSESNSVRSNKYQFDKDVQAQDQSQNYYIVKKQNDQSYNNEYHNMGIRGQQNVQNIYRKENEFKKNYQINDENISFNEFNPANQRILLSSRIKQESKNSEPSFKSQSEL